MMCSKCQNFHYQQHTTLCPHCEDTERAKKRENEARWLNMKNRRLAAQKTKSVNHEVGYYPFPIYAEPVEDASSEVYENAPDSAHSDAGESNDSGSSESSSGEDSGGEW